MRFKSNNKGKVLDVIKNYGPITIKDIARLCSLSIPSVTAIIDLFLADGLLLEQVSEELMTGRRPKLICINPDYGFVVGIDLGIINSAYVGFFDFTGKMIYRDKLDISVSEQGNEILDIIIDAIKAIIDGFDQRHGKLRAIVIGNPGIVNPQTGCLTLAAPTVRWADLPVNQIFQKAFDTAVITLNDVNLSAIGEKEFGAGRGYQNSIFVRIGIGLKAGIIFHNSLYQGDTGSAGEIGNNVIICKDPRTDEMQVIPAETLISSEALYKKISSMLPDHTDDIFYALVGGDKNAVNIDTILKALGSGNSYVCKVIQEAGYLLGYALSNLASTLDIALIIIGGDLVKLHNYIFKPIREAVSAVLPSPPAIITSSLSEDVALWGAASVGLEHVMQKLKKA